MSRDKPSKGEDGGRREGGRGCLLSADLSDYES